MFGSFWGEGGKWNGIKFVGGIISELAEVFRKEKLVFHEKMTFYKISRGVFFEKIGGVFFVGVESSCFLESYAVFWGTIYRASPEAGWKQELVDRDFVLKCMGVWLR
jgi:hypothetical protein